MYFVTVDPKNRLTKFTGSFAEFKQFRRSRAQPRPATRPRPDVTGR